MIRYAMAFVVVGFSAQSKGEGVENCPMHQPAATPRGEAQSQSTDREAHFAGVDQRGDKAMGFSHQRTAHHFGLTRNGGFISAEATDAGDTATRDAIRVHFRHIRQSFSSGDFKLPMLIHSKSPPGVDAMKKLKASIRYTFQESQLGGRVVIATENTAARDAIHRFLRFQIEDHRTGDSVAISD
jgi:hypothetical protein